jgi:hypothetical protein
MNLWEYEQQKPRIVRALSRLCAVRQAGMGGLVCDWVVRRYGIRQQGLC